MKNVNPFAILIVGILGANVLWVVSAFIYAKINLPDGNSIRCVGLWKTSNRKVYFTESTERALENPNKEICRGGNIYSVEIWSASVDKNDVESMRSLNKFGLNDVSRTGDIKDISAIPEGRSQDPKVDISKMQRW